MDNYIFVDNISLQEIWDFTLWLNYPGDRFVEKYFEVTNLHHKFGE